MENELNISISEGFSSLFQKGWFVKGLGVFGLGVLLPLLCVLLTAVLIGFGTVNNNIVLIVLGVFMILVDILVFIFSTFVYIGYYHLYAHDRANDKNALYRAWSKDTIGQSFVTGAKMFLLGIIQIPFAAIILLPGLMIMVIVMIFVTQGLGINENSVTAQLIASVVGIIPYLVYSLTFGILFTKIIAYFLKDLSLNSMFQWGNALNYTKGVKGLISVIVTPILYGAVLSTVYSILYTQLLPKIGPWIALIFTPIFVLITISQIALMCNLLGQYSYNSTEKNKMENAQ